MFDIIELFKGGDVMAIIMGVITLATAITAATPSRSDDKVVQKVLDFINLLAGNIGKNKNKDR